MKYALLLIVATIAHKIHVIDVDHNRMARDRRFDVDFDRDISTGPARPHGVLMLSDRRNCGRRCD